MANLWEILAEETREAIYQLENLTSALDVKSSVIIAIDAILFSALLNAPKFAEVDLIFRSLIVIPLFFSILSAVCCLYPRKWHRFSGKNFVDKYISCDNPDYVASTVANTFANMETELGKAYGSKFCFFKLSIVLLILPLIIESILFIYLLLGP
jgi:hypothetical protein